MTSRDFLFWLQGFIEIAEPAALTTQHVEIIRRHVALVLDTDKNPHRFILWLSTAIKTRSKDELLYYIKQQLATVFEPHNLKY